MLHLLEPLPMLLVLQGILEAKLYQKRPTTTMLGGLVMVELVVMAEQENILRVYMPIVLIQLVHLI
jgi:hypothetical protein